MSGGDDGARRAGGRVVVLGLGHPDNPEGLAVLASAIGYEQGGHPVELELVGHVDAALTRVASRPDASHVVVIDPSWAVERPDEARRLCLTLAFATRPVRIVLWGEPTPAAMRGVALCSRWVSCELVVRGVEDGRLAEIAREATNRQTAVREPAPDLIAVVRAMPSRLRAVWSWVAPDAERATVKAVASRAGLTPRSLERWHRDAGLPSPGRVIRLLRELSD